MVAHYERTEADPPPVRLLVQFAELFGVGVDELLGRKGAAVVASATPPQSLRLWRKLRQVEKFPESDRKRVLDLIEVLDERQQLRKKGSSAK